MNLRLKEIKRGMKKRGLTILLLIMAALILVAAPIIVTASMADVTYAQAFPDANFCREVLAFINVDGGSRTAASLVSEADQATMASWTWLGVGAKNIADLTGIEYFSGLTSLEVSDNNLTSLDLSKNTKLTGLWCDRNQLTSLNLTQNTELTFIRCHVNKLASLDVSKNTALVELYCHWNALAALDVSNNTALALLDCANNDLTKLDIAKNNKLESLWCTSNKLTALDVTALASLVWLDCDNNQLTTLDVSKNTKLTGLFCNNNLLIALNAALLTDLEYFNCGFNQLTLLNVSNSTKIKQLSCYVNQLTTLNVPPSTTLDKLSCFMNELTALDISKNPALKELECQTNRLTSLDVSQNTALELLWCHENQITALDLSSNAALVNLNCSGNKLTAFNISQKPKLENLNCSDNQMSQLNISGAAALTILRYAYNPLSMVDISGLPALETLDVQKCQLTTLDVSKNTALKWLRCEDNQLTALDITSCPALEGLSCEENQLTALDVRNNTALDYLSCNNNRLTSLDVRNNTALAYLNCARNQLTVLDVTKNIALTGLDCAMNRIAALDVSNSPTLGYLYCFSNEIAKLDVSKNPRLKLLYCNGNQLTALDLTNNAAIEDLRCSNDQLATLTLAPNNALVWLWCGGSKLTALDVSGAAALRVLACPYSNLSSLDVTKNTELENLDCRNNNFAVLDLTKATKLLELSCSDNRIRSLDLSNNPLLADLECSNNDLARLDVSKNTALERLWCSGNQLITLDMSQNTALTRLWCEWNLMTTLDLSKNTALEFLSCRYNYMNSPDDVKGWRERGLVINSPNNVYSGTFYFYLQAVPNQLTYFQAFPDPIFRQIVLALLGGDRTADSILHENDKVFLFSRSELDVSNKGIADLRGIEYFAGLTKLWCQNNQLSTINVSNCSALTELYCFNNFMTYPDNVVGASGNPKLIINTPTNPDSGTFRFYNQIDVVRTITITAQPPDIDIIEGSNDRLSITVAVAPSGLPAYQWYQRLGAAVDPSSDTKLGTADNLPVAAFTEGTYYFYCVVSAPGASDQTSRVAIVIIRKATYAALFPDAVFRGEVLALLNTDGGGRTGDSIVSNGDKARLATVDTLYISDRSIASLQGIEYFTGLQRLNCQRNLLTSLYLSSNTALQELHCELNQLVDLVVASNRALTYLNCSYNKLTGLYVAENTALTRLECNNNYIAAPSDVIGWQALGLVINSQSDLESGTFRYYNQLEPPRLNYSEAFPDAAFRQAVLELLNTDGGLRTDSSEVNNADKAALAARSELNITNLSIANLSGIEYFSGLKILNCGNNRLAALDVSQNPALTHLFCSGNQLTALDTSKNTALAELQCQGNKISSVDLTGNIALTYFACWDNPLSGLNVNQNTALTALYCGNSGEGDKWAGLDVSKNTKLEILECWGLQLSSLDVTQNPALTRLHCGDNELTSLDVSKNTALIALLCGDNKLSVLDITQNTKLNELRCGGNQLTVLDVSKNLALELLYVQNNLLPSLNAVIGWQALNLILNSQTNTESGTFRFYNQNVDIEQPDYTIITQPVAETIVTEGNISGNLFIETKTVVYVPNYQWYSNTINSNSGGTPVAGATSTVLPIPTNLTAAGSPYYYYCELTHELFEPRASSVAKVVVESGITPVTIDFDVTIRDFKADGILFEAGNGTVIKGLVAEQLGADKKPALISQQWFSFWSRATQFMLDSLFNDAAGFNMTIAKKLTMSNDVNGFFVLDHPVGSEGFFPIDNQLFGNEGLNHNFHFSLEYHGEFKYQGYEEFELTSDDDSWLFINNKLAIDLGGLHSATTEKISLPDLVAKGILNIKPGDTVDLDLFFMERQSTGSVLNIKTNLVLNSRVVLDKIEVTTKPAKLIYRQGENLDLTGLVVTATYTEGSSKPVTNYTTSPNNGAALFSLGETTVMVSYEEGGVTKTTTFTVTVNEALVPPGLSGPTTMTLTAGYAATSTGAYTLTGNPTPTVTIDNHHGGRIIWNATTQRLDIAAGLAAGTYPVVLTASNGVSPDAALVFMLTVYPLNHIINFGVAGGEGMLTATVDGSPIRNGTAVEQGKSVLFEASRYLGLADDPIRWRIKEWKHNGIVVNGTNQTYTISNITAPHTVTVEFELIPDVLEGIKVTTLPAKTVYNEGDPLDLIGMIVTATYADGSSEPVTGYSTAPVNGSALSKAGDQTVTVSYTKGAVTKTDSFTVKVEEARITSAAITVTAPKVGEAPSSIAIGTGRFAVGNASWNPGHNPFREGFEYTVTIRLTAEANYTFAGLQDATVNGYPATISFIGGGSAVDISYKFPMLKLDDEAPTITGPNTMTLTAGYAATSTGAYTLTGAPTPTVTIDNNHGGRIAWNATTSRLDIAAGLAAGEYVVWLTASNGVTPNDTLKFTLTVSPLTHTVTFSVVNGNGSLTATVDGLPITSPAQVEQGKTVVFTAAPNNGYRVKEWKDNTVVVPGNTTTSHTIGSIAAAHTVTVEFELVPFVLERIEVTTLPTKIHYYVDDPLTLAGLVVTAYYSDGSSKAVAGYSTSMVNGDILSAPGTITIEVTYTEGGITKKATFTIEVYQMYFTVTYSVIPVVGGNGTLTATTNLGATPVPSGAMVYLGTQIRFTATPDPGYKVKEWKVNGNVVTGMAVSGTDNEIYDFEVRDTTDVTVEFELKTITTTRLIIFEVIGGNGTLTAFIAGGADIQSGYRITNGHWVAFTAKPDALYRVKEWTLNKTVVNGKNPTYGVDVWEDIHVTVEFELIPDAPEYNFNIYVDQDKYIQKVGDTFYVDIMLWGDRNYTQMTAEILYDTNLLEYAGYTDLLGWAASVSKSAADKVAVRNVPSMNMVTGASCSPAIRIVRLAFTAKGGFTGDSIETSLSFASALVSPAAGVVGTTTEQGQPVKITLQK